MGIGNGIVIKIGSDVKDAIAGINRVEGALGRSLTAGEKWNRMSTRLAQTATVAAAAAGAFALKLGYDAVQAAIEDEKALTALNRTLDNLGFSYATQEVDGFIGRLQMLYGVSDSELRPAFDRLVRSTRDVGDAERALQIALDASAGSGRSVQEIAEALGRAYDGNTTSLGRLGLGIDKATLKSGDLDLILRRVADTFQGQASAAADTMQGRLNRLGEAAAEASEEIGYSLVRALDGLTGSAGPEGAAGVMKDFGEAISQFIDGVGILVREITTRLAPNLDNVEVKSEAAGKRTLEWTDALLNAEDPLQAVGNLIFNVAHNADVVEERQRNAAAATAAWTARYLELANAIAIANAAQAASAVADRYTALAVREYGASIRYAGGNLREYLSSLNATTRAMGGGGGGGGTSSALDRVNPRIERQTALIRDNIEALEAQASRLDDARQALGRYADGIASALTGGIDLQDAWEQQLKDEATIRELDQALADAIAKGDAEGIAKAQAERAAAGTAQSWIDNFIRQIDDTVAFSGALGRLGQQLPNTPGAQLLIDQLAGLGTLGGTGLIDGLGVDKAGELAAKLDAALQAAGGSGGLLAKHFYGEGVSAAERTLLGMTEQIARDEEKLLAIGRRIGQPIGAEIRAEIAAAVASALTGTEYQATISGVLAGIVGAAGDTFNINIPPTVADPVGSARAIESTLRKGRVRRP